jgi:prepilin-type processing-associated H-X9-DG protein
VVIAIIAILAAILFPVFAQAREKARQAACLSNGKQMGTAISMYATDYDDTAIPVWYRRNGSAVAWWFQLTDPYTKNRGVLSCPSDVTSLPNNYPNILGLDPSYQLSYGYNCIRDDKAPGGFTNPINYDGVCTFDGPDANNGGKFGIPLAEMQSPSELIILSETSNFNYHFAGDGNTDWGSDGDCDGFGARAGKPCILARRHNGGFTNIFCDGHAKWMKRTEKKNWYRRGA